MNPENAKGLPGSDVLRDLLAESAEKDELDRNERIRKLLESGGRDFVITDQFVRNFFEFMGNPDAFMAHNEARSDTEQYFKKGKKNGEDTSLQS